MKLSAQYSRVNIIVTVAVLFIAGFVYYGTINYIANSQLDDSLKDELDEVTAYVNQNRRLPKPLDFEADQTSFVKTNDQIVKPVFFDTTYAAPKEKHPESGRAVLGSVSLNSESYKVIVIESKEATEHLLQFIALITLILTALLLVTLTIANRYVLNGLWRPFYEMLLKLKSFNISDKESLNLTPTKIDEFKELNDAVVAMSSRVKNEYQNLKVFTENASHEMMTPIAVITSKLDTLIQDETLRSEQYTYINDIYTATNKMARLNQSLLLLVKIENDLINDISVFDLKEVIAEKLQQFHELIENKRITINSILHNCDIEASRYLIDILINNLFNNAIKHNIGYGSILINLSGNKLIFQNTGSEEALDADEIFERFQKGKTSDGTGLGLTIVKNICNQYNYKLQYYFEDPLHTFQVDFA